jgi:hypothetical protein
VGRPGPAPVVTIGQMLRHAYRAERGAQEALRPERKPAPEKEAGPTEFTGPAGVLEPANVTGAAQPAGPKEGTGPRGIAGLRGVAGPARVPRPTWLSVGVRAAAFGCLLFALVAVGAPRPAAAWTPNTQMTIAEEAARLAPPDLARQIKKRQAAFEAGVVGPFEDADPERHRKYADGSGRLDAVLLGEVAGAVAAIRSHQPFDEIVRRMGVVAHYVADANNPLASSGEDLEAGRYFVDYLRYAESALPRFPLVFYGVQPGLEDERGVSSLIGEALRRGRELYPLVGQEYRKIEFGSGVAEFDDRSTAFAVASVSFSHAVTDVTLVLRYIWIRAGGADDRTGLPAAGSRLLLLPRASLSR